jgi:hypothetical protein
MVFTTIKNAYIAFRNFFDTHHRTMLKRGVALSPEDEAYLKLAVPKEKTPAPEYTENGARKRKDDDGVIEVMSSEKIRDESVDDLVKLALQKDDKIAVSDVSPVFTPAI